MLGLRKVLDQLQAVPEEQPIEPELKTAANKERDREIKEQQDLRAGAVLQAVTSQGEGNSTPNEGDLVYVHYSVLNADSDLLYTTWAEEGGSGQPLAFVLGKGCRAPRAWELAVLDMTRNSRKQLKVQPSYGYRHPDCGMQPPPGVAPDQVLQFSLQLVSWYPAKEVRVLGDGSNIFKRILKDSSKWEVARPPNEVVFSIKLSTPAYDGVGGGGKLLVSHPAASPCRLQLGNHTDSGLLLPPGLEAALCALSKGERALFVIPAADMQQPDSSSSSKGSSGRHQQQQQQSDGVSLSPALPPKCVQVEAEVELLDLVQVRDVTGDGGVVKKRLREGQGEFPVDCPLHDTTVRLHYKVRSLAGGTPGPWLYDTRSTTVDGTQHGVPGSDSSNSSSSAAPGGPPVEVDTGCGELPEGLELVVKLMVPGESAAATCTPRYAYEAHGPPPAGISPVDPVEFEVELVSFDREGYWQHLGWSERWALADRLKDKGNALFKAKHYQFATNKYTHLLRLIESTRDYEEQEQVDKADGYKAALLSNLALASFHLEEYARSIEWCDKALQMDPSNAKAMFRKGKAMSMKGDYEEAHQHLAAAAEMDDSLTAEVEAACAANKQREKAAASKQKEQFRNFFGKK